MSHALPKVRVTVLRLRRFDPTAVFGPGWSMSRYGRDRRWDDLTQIDLAKLRGENCWHGKEKYHLGETRRKRLLREHRDAILVGPSLAVALQKDPGKFPEEWKQLTLFCDQLVVRHRMLPHLSICRYAVCFYWANESVFIKCRALYIGRTEDDFSLVLK